MKKIILLILLLSSQVFAYEIPKDNEYYKSQIQNQRFLYSNVGMLQAIKQDNADVVELFMLSGFDSNAKYIGVPMTYYAVKLKSVNSLESLLRHGANPNITMPDISLLNWAIQYKSSDSVAALIKYGVDVNMNYRGALPLNKAIASNQSKIVELLLEAGAKPDEKTLKLVNKSKDEYIKALFVERKD